MNNLLIGHVSSAFEPILSLSVAMIFGLFLTRLMKLLKLPNVTGYLIAGLLVGPHLLNFVSTEGSQAYNVFGLSSGVSVFGTSAFTGGGVITTIALGFIAFSIGSSFEMKHMRSLGKKVTVITLFQALLTAFLVDAVLIVISLIDESICPMPVAIILGAIATATAPAATLMVVRQYKADGPVTKTLLPVVALDDAIGLMVFAVSFAIAGVMLSGQQPTINTILLEPLFEIVGSLVLGAVLGALITLAMRFFMSRANKFGFEIASVFAGVALADMFGLSTLLVCMMIGAVYCNLHKGDTKLNSFSERWTTPVFMLFFVISGAELDLTIIPQVGLIGILYLVFRSIGKWLGSFIGAKTVKAEKNVVKFLGLTLLPQAGVAIGMATIVVSKLGAMGYPEIGAQINTVVLCATVIYELFGPLITKWALTKSGEISTCSDAEEVHDHTFVMPIDKVAKRVQAESLFTDAEAGDQAPCKEAEVGAKTEK